MSKHYELKVRFKNVSPRELKKAAKAKKWSVNTLVEEAVITFLAQ